MMEYFLLFIFLLAILVAIFLLCREIFCWYWKINERVKNQEDIIRLLRKIANESETPPAESMEKKPGILKELSDSTKFIVSGK